MEEKKIDDKYTSVSIPTSLADRIKKRIQKTDFPTISAYITYVLEEVVSDAETEDNEELSKEDEERIKARLRSLGYLD